MRSLIPWRIKVLKAYAGEQRNCASLISRIVFRLKACGDCQRRRSACPDNERTRSISAATAAGSIDRCSMSGGLRFRAVADHTVDVLAVRLLGVQCEGASFLRTKPRTECACQPVTAMMAVMVVPLGRLNSASTAACFDLSVF
jgi:hypothetical protein